MPSNEHPMQRAAGEPGTAWLCCAPVHGGGGPNDCRHGPGPDGLSAMAASTRAWYGMATIGGLSVVLAITLDRITRPRCRTRVALGEPAKACATAWRRKNPQRFCDVPVSSARSSMPQKHDSPTQYQAISLKFSAEDPAYPMHMTHDIFERDVQTRNQRRRRIGVSFWGLALGPMSGCRVCRSSKVKVPVGRQPPVSMK